MAIFEGSAVALVLPMHEDGSIDFEGFKKQVQRMIDGGVQALLVNGTTGETATITMEDEFELLDITLKMAKGTGVKVIAGAGSNDTATALTKAKKAKEKGVNLVLAVDAKIADAFSNDANTKFCAVDEIPDGWEGLDIGPKSEEIFAEVIKNSKTILWNGPTGVFEFENFTHGSRSVGEAIVEATKNGAFSLVGGGDSVACVNKFGLANGVSYVSTGGGALLEAIEGKVLPGIAAIQE